MKSKVLVIDIGGSHVKLMLSRARKRKFKSGPDLTPREFVSKTLAELEGWAYDAVSIGFPSPVRNGKIVSEPKHLGKGWVRFNFEKALGKPIRMINDAAMQALGSYRGGRMLFLGLGTGLGSTLVWKDHVLPLELGDLPYHDGLTIEEVLGKGGALEPGTEDWKQEVALAVTQLKKAFIADYVVLGGGNVKKLDVLPAGAERGQNRNAYLGGTRLWLTEPRTGRARWCIL